MQGSQLWEPKAVVGAEDELAAEQEGIGGGRSVDGGRRLEGAECNGRMGSAVAAAAGKDRLAAGSAGRRGVSMGVAAEVAAGSATPNAPLTRLWQAEALAVLPRTRLARKARRVEAAT